VLVGYLENLGFQKELDFCEAIGEKKPAILENTTTVGEHVCTWISPIAEDRTERIKIYNKIVSNFEAGEIREQFGGHLADYANCPNPHLRQIFQHPDVQARGCTRIEVSLYGYQQKKTVEQESRKLHRESLGAGFRRRRGGRSLRGPTPQQTVAKPSR